MSLNLSFISSEFNLNVVSDSDRISYLFEDYRLDKPRRMLYRGEKDLALPPKAVETLIALIERRGDIVTKEHLMEAIWADTIVEDSNLAHHLHVLRKALGRKRDGSPFIETFRRRGYRFTSDVDLVEEPAPSNGNGQKARVVRSEDSHPSSPEGLTESVAAVPTPIHPRSSYRTPILVGAVFGVAFLSATVAYLLWQGLGAGRITAERGEVSTTLLTNGKNVLDAAISPDGKYFAYHEEDDGTVHLWMQQTGQAGRIEVVPADDRTIGPKTFSPNGTYLYYVGREKEDLEYSLFRVPTIGGPVTRILTDIASLVSFSPDGTEMAFIRRNENLGEFQLVVAKADGTDERVVLTRTGTESLSLGGPAWSPDGKLIAFGNMDVSRPGGEGPCSIMGVEIETGAEKVLSPERWDNCYRLAWSPSGKGLAFVGTRVGESYSTRRDQIYYISIADGRSHRLSTEGNRYDGWSIGLTADNSLFAVPLKAFSQIWEMNADGDPRTVVQLTSGQTDGMAGVAPLPDGRIGYITRAGENRSIWIMGPDGSNQRQIYDQMPFVAALRATPDGRFFIFSARNHSFSHLYRIGTDGRNLTQLTEGESHEIASTVSPDSRWVYHGTNVFDGQVWRVFLQRTSIDDGQTSTLKEIEAAALAPQISPDGKSITCPTYGGLKVYSSQDGSLLSSIDADKRADWWTGARWTPDGRSVTYLVNRKNNVSVWVQPVNGSSTPRPLTQFPTGSVYFHTFSLDGTKLYVAYGYQVHDAVLIKNF